MTETEKAVSVAAIALVLAAGALSIDTKVDPEAKDVKALAVAESEGKVPPFAVYEKQRSDGGKVYVVVSKDDAGAEFTTFIDESPCAWRPLGGKDCTLADGGNPGDENTMQAGTWAGAGCVRKSCVVIAGEQREGK